MSLQKVNEHHFWILDEVEIDIDSELPLISGLSRHVPRIFTVFCSHSACDHLMLPLIVGDLGVTLTEGHQW